MASAQFPASYWDPQFHLYLTMIEFLRTDWINQIQLDEPPADPRDEIETLLHMKDDPCERAAHLADILAQNTDFPFAFYFRGFIFNATSHRKTYELMWVAILVGRAVVMHYKNRYNRARPSQLDPRIAPAIDVPGHPAYPSGHSTQMHLVAHCLSSVIPGSRTREIVMAFADDVAKNRERAGLHYPSDSQAGVSLAAQIFAILERCQQFSEMQGLARSEWT